MVDTPRTLAEIEAILADNNTGAISAQDMRDVVQSLVAPVPQGGIWPHKMVYYQTGIISSPISVPNNTPTPLPLGSAGVTHGLKTLNDDDGWAAAGEGYSLDGADPSNSWSTTWPTGHAIMLPPGMYIAKSSARWTSPYPTWQYSPTKYASAYFDQARFDPDWPTYPTAGFDDPGFHYWNYWNASTIVWTPSMYTPPTPNPGYPYTTDISYSINDTDEAQPFVFVGHTVGQPTPLSVDFYGVSIIKIGVTS